jgi:hypothetical protein
MLRAVCLWLLLLTPLVRAHMDPAGEIHPNIQANADGTFTVTYRQNEPGEQSAMRFQLDASGRLLIPRHRFTPAPPAADGDSFTKSPPELQTTDHPAEPNRLLRVWPARPPAEAPVRRLLPFRYHGAYEAGRELAGADAAVVLGRPFDDPNQRFMFLELAWTRVDRARAQVVQLGPVAEIYHFPCATAPVWSRSRWWVAWVTSRAAEAGQCRYVTVLSSVDPATGGVTHAHLPGWSDWNSHLDLAANPQGTLVAVWHAADKGLYPGQARLYHAALTPPP